MDPWGHREQTLLMECPNIGGYRSGMGNPFISGDIWMPILPPGPGLVHENAGTNSLF